MGSVTALELCTASTLTRTMAEDLNHLLLSVSILHGPEICV